MFSTIKMSSYFRIVLLILLAIVKKDDKLEGSADIVFFCHDDDRGWSQMENIMQLLQIV